MIEDAIRFLVLGAALMAAFALLGRQTLRSVWNWKALVAEFCAFSKKPRSRILTRSG
jgi:hypothetical protein